MGHQPSGSVQNPTASTGRLADVPDNIEMVPVQIVSEDGVTTRGLLYRPKRSRASVGIHIMHPRADLYAHYSILPLALAGYTVLAQSTRWPNNDTHTIHERLLLDVAAGLRFLARQGCARLVLLGPAGGGSLAAFYQAQATAPVGSRLTETPAGDPFDLNRFDLPAADGLIVFGAHVGQGAVLAKMIDPSVVDEDDPLGVDPALDMYAPANGFVTPPAPSRYAPEFLARYRAAQLARVERIDAKARALLASQRRAAAIVAALGDRASPVHMRAAIVEHVMIVYRTTADPDCVDLGIDPDDRRAGSYHGTRPDMENYAADGFSRVTTPRAWLSTWSAVSSNAGTARNLAKVDVPLLIVHNAGDAETRLREIGELFDAAASADKQVHIVRGVDHSGFRIRPDGSAGERASEGVDVVRAWLEARFPAGN